jgi:UDP-glucose 4-epimerase
MAFHRFLTAALSESSITLYGDGQQTRDFTFVQDVVDATIAASKIGRAGKIYNIGGGSPVTLSQSLDLISSCIGRPLDIKYEVSQRGDMPNTYADITLARQDLNYEPAVSLADGIRAEYQWMSNTKVVS